MVAASIRSSSSSSSGSRGGAREAEAEAEDPGMTEIERQRLENIKRNEEVLMQAGLGGGQSLLGRRKHHQQQQGGVAGGDAAARRKRAAVPPPKKPAPEPTRRSLRNLGKEAPDYREAPDIKPLPALSGREGRFKWASGPGAAGSDGDADLGPGESLDAATLRAAASRAAAAAAERSGGPAPGSSRTMAADVAGMLATYLGRKVPYTGKACVMELLTPQGSGAAKFSKYAGVVEWANAIVLWVNVDGSDYDNLFLKGGREMTWFAGSRATGETPVILRLLEAGQEQQQQQQESHKPDGPQPPAARDEILLFCRLQGEPYVCMGRVHHTWYETRRHPVKVVWRLRDYEAIRESPDAKEIWGDAAGGADSKESEPKEDKKK